MCSSDLYVNLFLPSRLAWTQNGSKFSITQHTGYPRTNTTQLQIDAARPEQFTIYLRVPAWTDSKTRVSVNGKSVEGELTPGKFFEINCTWKNGDRIEYEIGMPLSLQAVDSQTPNTVALRRGPLAYFAIGNTTQNFTRAQLLAATAAASTSDDWIVQSAAGKTTFRPFGAIGNEDYRLYHNVAS